MKISAQFMKRIFCFLGMLLLLTPLTVLAQTKVVVIPLFGDDAKPLKNIVTVAKANGNFADPVAAVNSIKDASVSNPYLVVIGPGIYTITQTLQMKEYVDITGSGENVTKLIGANGTFSSESSVVISGANNSALSSLTLESVGGGTSSIAMYNDHASPTVSNVTAKASGGTHSYGVSNTSSLATMTNVTATASGEAPNNFGVCNLGSTIAIMTNVTASASGVASSIGVFNSPDSISTIRRGTISGNTKSLHAEGISSIAMVNQSTITNAVGGTGIIKCVFCDNGSGSPLGADCK